MKLTSYMSIVNFFICHNKQKHKFNHFMISFIFFTDISGKLNTARYKVFQEFEKLEINEQNLKCLYFPQLHKSYEY